ncbi:MAG: AAA family ATPase [Pseudomonadota bacterium]
MYTDFFGLNEKPFSITPDPRYLFMSERHGEALAHLVYGVTESGGFIQLTGEVGTGKTTLCRSLLMNRMPSNADVAVVLNPQLSALEFLEAICEELGITVPEPRGSIKALIDALNGHLLTAHAEGRRTILVVDEAQNLAPDVLEEVRLLTNLETAKQKLLQIILIGQPELRELLARNDLRQLAQRITGRYHLEPLSRDEADQYIEHRLKVAGALGEVFDNGARREVFKLSQGVPRLINVICDRALLGAYSQGTRIVNKRLVRRAAREITGEPDIRSTSSWLWPVAGLATAAVVALGAFLALGGELPKRPFAPAADAAVADSIEPTNDSSSPITEPATPVDTDLVVTEEPAPSLNEQLALASELTGREPAFRALTRLWGIDDSTPSSCSNIVSSGLSCLRGRGSWSGLRQLDRPAILTLVDDEGGTHRVVLTAIEGSRAQLSIGGVEVTHAIGDITDLWFGSYELIWQPPNGTAISLNPGVRGANVLWLRQSLASIDNRYRAEPFDSDVYDAGLADQVRAFQRDHRLDVDGLAGQQTQIIVNSLLAPDRTPRLNTARLAQE